MQLVDLHNHTKYSYDGANTPEEVIENAINHNMQVIGISDHQFSMPENLQEYIEHINHCKNLYKEHITVLCGLEIGTRPKPADFLASKSEDIDYCIFESLDSPVAMDFFEFIEWQKLFKCKKGLAHTDIFALSDRYGINILKVLKKQDIFWELNTSGNYNYYYDFLTNARKRNMVSASGVSMSIGSDTHWIGEFNIDKIKRANKLIIELGNPCIFSN